MDLSICTGALLLAKAKLLLLTPLLALKQPGSMDAVRGDRKTFFVLATDRFISPFYCETVPRPAARVNNTPLFCHTPARSSCKDSRVGRIAACS
jgi:hypothetical protein